MVWVVDETIWRRTSLSWGCTVGDSSWAVNTGECGIYGDSPLSERPLIKEELTCYTSLRSLNTIINPSPLLNSSLFIILHTTKMSTIADGVPRQIIATLHDIPHLENDFSNFYTWQWKIYLCATSLKKGLDCYWGNRDLTSGPDSNTVGLGPKHMV